MFRRFCRPASALASALTAAGARVPQVPAAHTLPAYVPVVLALAVVCIATPSMATHGLAGALPGDVTTYHVDNLRTGWAQSETALTPATVGGPNFGLVAQVPLDEQVDAQPLYLGGVTIAGAVHDVVYVATENNTIYAIDAESGQILLSNNLGQAVPINVLPGYCNNNSYNMGVNSTPVIDRAAGLMYVMTYTFENAVPVFRIHAISLTTLQDTIPPSPSAAPPNTAMDELRISFPPITGSVPPCSKPPATSTPALQAGVTSMPTCRADGCSAGTPAHLTRCRSASFSTAARNRRTPFS